MVCACVGQTEESSGFNQFIIKPWNPGPEIQIREGGEDLKQYRILIPSNDDTDSAHLSRGV